MRTLEGHRVSSKSPLRVRDRDIRVAGRNGSEKCFPDEGSWICPPGKSMSFHKKETEKNSVSGQTWTANRLKPEYVSEDVSNGRMADSSTVPILHPPKFVVDKINTMASNEVVSSQQQSNKRRGRPLRSSRVAKQKQDFKSKIVPSLRTYYDRTKEVRRKLKV